MKLSLALISTLLTSSLALSVKRQNDVPSCVNGDVADSNGGPYEGGRGQSRSDLQRVLHWNTARDRNCCVQLLWKWLKRVRKAFWGGLVGNPLYQSIT
ncbi:hypothetical protein J4E80_009753 [Alternaria sp. BMP 0032]|nr:hypothetical protein J4E80_009753 [Alternaria sp. BMP 0032]